MTTDIKNTTEEYHVTIANVISHYNLIGMAVAVALGFAGQVFLFSLIDDIILPGMGKIFRTKFSKNYKFDMDHFISSTLTFILVGLIIVFLLYIVLRPMVKEEIIAKKEKRDV